MSINSIERPLPKATQGATQETSQGRCTIKLFVVAALLFTLPSYGQRTSKAEGSVDQGHPAARTTSQNSSQSSNGRKGETAFPEEELAQESVLPIYDLENSVRNRNVITKKRFEVGFFGGWVTDESLYNQNQYGLLGTYHFDETHGLNFTFGMHAPGIGNYAKELGHLQNPVVVPEDMGPKSYLIAQYQFTGYYGKLSILKNSNINLHIYGLLGAGVVNFRTANEMVFDFGLGEKFYFTNNFALRIDFRVMTFNGPNAISPTQAQLKNKSYSSSDFKTATFSNTHMDVGFVWLF